MLRPLAFAVLVLAFLAAGCSATGPQADRSEHPARDAEAAPGEAIAEVDLPSRRVVRPFPVIESSGEPYALPFLGGLNVPRPQLVDIDGDGDFDLFVQEYTGAVMYLENVGSSVPVFEWRSDKYRDLDIGEWYRFADVDLDGDMDLLAEQRFSYIRYYENVGSATEPRFVAAADTLRDVEGRPLFSDRQNIPNVVDIDCNGAVDLFVGKLDGTIARYEAVATDPVPVFRLVTDRFEGIEIVAQFGQPGAAGRVPLPNVPGRELQDRGPSADASAPGIPAGTESARNLFGASTMAPTTSSLVGANTITYADRELHGANTMTFADIDGDGDLDLFWGDFFEPSLLEIENTGSCPNPVLRGEPQPFPPPDPIQSSGYNAPTFGDVDGDGDMDLLVGVLGGAFNPIRTEADNLYYYEQLGEDHFELRTRRFLDQLDVGSESFPALADLDGDGDEDLLVGNKLSQSNTRTSELLYLENLGDEYRVRDTLRLLEAYNYAPALGDLDGDGDLDLLLGTWNDGVAFYRNQGSAASPRFELVEAGFVRLTRGSHTTPALVDIDGDGDLDLFVGETSGTINFYENVGDASEPLFELVSDEYAGIDVGRRGVPAFLDVDGDGDYDLVAGSETGGLSFFRNVGTPTDPQFDSEGRLPIDVPAGAVPAFGDPDGDGALEMILGVSGGGLLYFDGE